MAGETSYGNGLVRILAQHQRLLAAALDQQIADRLVVDFQVGERDLGGLCFLHLLYLLEKLLHGHEDDARLLRCSRDGMRLSTARSAVRKDGRIVSLQHAVQQGLRSSFVDVALRSSVVKDTIKGKRLVL